MASVNPVLGWRVENIDKEKKKKKKKKKRKRRIMMINV